VTSTPPLPPRSAGAPDPPRLVERTPRTWITHVAAVDLPGAVAEAAALGGGPLRWWVTEPTAADEAAAAAAGLVPERDLWQLRVPLPLDGPSDIAVRSFVVGRDEDAWLEVNNRAFDWHPEQGGWTLDMLRARFAEPWFDPAGFLLHDDASGRPAGFVWTKVHPRSAVDPELGEIYVIGVDPDFSGRGLGRSLTLVGFDWLHRERGVDTGMLYVDATNTPAVHLYTDLGMTRDHTDRAFLGVID
jgi:mycothiol synthase